MNGSDMEVSVSPSASKKDDELSLQGWSRTKYNFYYKFAQLEKVNWDTPEADEYGIEMYGQGSFTREGENSRRRRSRAKNALKFFNVKDGKLYYDPQNGEEPRIVVSSEQIPAVLKQYHDDIRHPGVRATFEAVTEAYVGISRATVQRYVKLCKNCKLMKEEHVRPLRKRPWSENETDTLVALWEHYRHVLFCPKSQEQNVTMRQAQMKAWEEITNQMNLFYPDQMRDKWELKTKFRSMVRRVKQKVALQKQAEEEDSTSRNGPLLTAVDERLSVLIQEAENLEADHNYFTPDVMSNNLLCVEDEVEATETGQDTEEANTPETRGVKRSVPDNTNGEMSVFERRMLVAYEKQTSALNKIQRTLDSLVQIQSQRLQLERRQQPGSTQIIEVPEELNIGNAGSVILEAVSILPEDL